MIPIPHTLRHVRHHLVPGSIPLPHHLRPHVVRTPRPRRLCPSLDHLPLHPNLLRGQRLIQPIRLRRSKYPIKTVRVTDPTATHARLRGQRETEVDDKHDMICVSWIGRVRFQCSELRRWTQHRTGHPSLNRRGLVGIERRLVQDPGDLGLVKVLRERLDLCGRGCDGGQRTRKEVTEIAFGGSPESGDTGVHAVSDTARDVVENVVPINGNVPGNRKVVRC